MYIYNHCLINEGVQKKFHELHGHAHNFKNYGNIDEDNKDLVEFVSVKCKLKWNFHWYLCN